MKKLSCDDLGKLLLRLAVGGLMLFMVCISFWRRGLYQRHAGGKAARIYRLRRGGGGGGTGLIIVGLFTRPAALVLALR